MLYPPGLEYIVAFFGCLYAGVVAVPAYPPNPARLQRTLPRLQSIAQDARPAVALTTAALLPLAEAISAQSPGFPELSWLATDTVADDFAAHWRDTTSGNTLAFLQYTSGSTAAPKGVMLTHGNLLHNLAQNARLFGHTPDSRGVIWLPPYHDMGLIGGILQPLYGGFPVTLMSPVDFLQRPMRWLQAITRYRATTSGGPSFAYDLCVRKITPEQRAALDLSSWDLAFNGAEPIQPATLRRFAEAFAPCGFRSQAFYPCYGLAEATLIVSGGTKGQLPTVRAFAGDGLADHRVVACTADAPTGRALVGCGESLPEQRILVVHPATRTPCSSEQVGEIWVAGPSVAQGYWRRDAETEATFQARPSGQGQTYLRTGDLGFLHQGQVFITGRLKDIIIIRGRNYYPQDIEQTAEQAHAALRPGCGAAFALPGEAAERLVIVHELDRTYREPDTTPIVRAIGQAVAEEHGVRPDQVVLIRHGGIPKTSSGKIQRYACRDEFLAGRLEVIAQVSLAPDTDEPVAPALTRDALLAAPLERRAALAGGYLLQQLAALTGQPAEHLRPQQRLSGLGLDSMMGIEAQHAIEAHLGVSLPLTVFLDDTTIAQLAAVIDAALPRYPTST